MSQFSTNEAVSLEKRIEFSSEISKTKAEDVNNVYEVDKCAKWILENDYKKVCLQFPDYLLPDSAKVVRHLEDIIQNKVYILGDTAYESCCIDYTAAKHVTADAIIHFGPTCFSKAENTIPTLKIYEKFDINVTEFCDKVKQKFLDNYKDVTIVVNTGYLYKLDDIKKEMSDLELQIVSIESDLCISNCTVLFLGPNDRKLMNINLSYNPKDLHYFDPNTSDDIQQYEQDMKILKRRYFFIEKIKDSHTIGIVISTLAVRNYLKIIERIKTLAKIHSKKHYIISVGKPTVAKLANFPEVDIFVVIGCAMNEIYENRDYYKPIVTPYDIEAALNPKLEDAHFSYDFNNLVDNELDVSSLSDLQSSDVSLLTGQIRYVNSETSVVQANATEEQQITLREDFKLQVSDNYGAGFLTNRSWKGLEPNLGQNAPQLATTGRKGVAQGYVNEQQ
ncbi:Diphthamide biosynthesis 2 [Carabus blaptoides fortunei]